LASRNLRQGNPSPRFGETAGKNTERFVNVILHGAKVTAIIVTCMLSIPVKFDETITFFSVTAIALIPLIQDLVKNFNDVLPHINGVLPRNSHDPGFSEARVYCRFQILSLRGITVQSSSVSVTGDYVIVVIVAMLAFVFRRRSVGVIRSVRFTGSESLSGTGHEIEASEIQWRTTITVLWALASAMNVDVCRIFC
jgi:hypothetical protein